MPGANIGTGTITAPGSHFGLSGNSLCSRERIYEATSPVSNHMKKFARGKGKLLIFIDNGEPASTHSLKGLISDTYLHQLKDRTCGGGTCEDV